MLTLSPNKTKLLTGLLYVATAALVVGWLIETPADLAAKEVFIIDQQTRLEDARKKKATLESELAQLVEKLSF